MSTTFAVIKDVAGVLAKETGKEIVREVLEILREEGIEYAREKIDEIKSAKKRIEDYSEMYSESSLIRDELEIAKSNPDTRRALLARIESDGKGNTIKENSLKGRMNEKERIADLAPYANIETEKVYKRNRVDIIGEARQPIGFTELKDRPDGIYLKDMYINKGESFAMECKDGDLRYLQNNLKDIRSQVIAGKELSKGKSLLQITPENFRDLKEMPIEKQREFLNKINDAGGQVIIMGTDPKTRIKAAKKAMKSINW